MSQDHIPQPNVGDSGEVIVSTETALPPTALEIPIPSTSQEIVPAVGYFNQIDPWFYQQNRRIDTVPWSVQDESGKLLWYVPISPLHMDKNLSYLMQLYLAWDGDFIFNFKVAGTGFHAGMITFAHFPPTIHPTSVRGPENFSIFSWSGCDPKMLEIGSVNGRDVRPIKYHYTQKQDNAPPDYYIGGYLALYVDLPLATSSSGVQQISIAIWMKCAPNFKVAQMLPYDLQTISPKAIAPPGLEFALNAEFLQMANMPYSIQHLIILPAATKQLNNGLVNTFNIDGGMNSKYPAIPNTTTFQTYTGQQYTVNGIEINEMDIIMVFRWEFYWDSIWLSGATKSAALGPSTKIEDDKITYTTQDGTGFTSTELCTASPVIGKIHPKQTKFVDNTVSALTNSESIIVFQYTTSVIHCIQSATLAKYFSDGRARGWFGKNQAALFMMYEVESGLPLGYVKMYHGGFFTKRATKDQVEILIGSVEFKFFAIVGATTEIPASMEAERNYMAFRTRAELLAYKHRRKNASGRSLHSSLASLQY